MADEDNELEGVPETGDVIVDKYRVDRVLGVGGMGCVVAATHLTLDQPVAIKFLLAKVAKNPKHVMRFQREAQAAARIKNDHVAKVSDVGTLPNGTPYMVMEFLEGEDLAGRLRRGPLHPQEAVDYLLQACEALAEAHQAGIVHRDLKPANLFLARRSDGGARVKVLDFGISKIISAPGQADLTKTTALMGSPLYMSPEQMMSAKAADMRTDIWALGCILFEAISCQPPFIGETLPEICSRILAHPPTKLRELVPSVPPELERVVERALSKEPSQRYQNLGEMAEALAPFASERGHRSINTIRRQLGQAELPLSLGASRGSFPPMAVHATHPGHHHPGHASGASVSQSGPQQALGAVTPLPGAVTPGGSYGSHPETYPTVVPALAQGASTAAPVAQTMSDGMMPARRSRLPVLLAVATLALGGIAAGVFFGIRGTHDSQAAAPPSAEPEQPPEEPSAPPATEAAIDGDDEPPPAAPSSAAPSAPLPVAKSPPAPPPPAKIVPPPSPVPPPAPPPVQPPAQPTTPTVRPGDDKFNTFNP